MPTDASQPTPGPGLAGDLSEVLAQLEGAVDAAIGYLTEPGSVTAATDEGLLDSLRRIEQVRNRLPVLDQALITEADRRELPQRYCQGSSKRFLAGLLRLSPAESARRVRAAESLCGRLSPTGEELPATRAALASAQHEGACSPEQVDVVLTALAMVDHRGFPVEEVSAAEELLTEFSTQFAPPDLRRLARHTVDAIDPDGTVPHDQVISDRRHLTLRQGRDGMWRGDFRLTPVAGAKLETVLRPLCRDRSTRLGPVPGDPQPQDGTGPTADGSGTGETRTSELGADGTGPDETDTGAVLGDERSYPQRLHDALEESCDLLLRSTELPDSGGTPATVILTLTADQLGRQSGAASTADGATVAVRDLPHLAGEAEVCTIVTSSTGAPLSLGRSRRIATPSQTLALIARDSGCSFPGCDRPPRWCERHHIRPWYAGGATDLDNFTLLCTYHHRHHLDRGWQVRLGVHGLPEWIPPAWIDPARRPRVNHRILTLHARPTAGGTDRGALRVRRPRSAAASPTQTFPTQTFPTQTFPTQTFPTQFLPTSTDQIFTDPSPTEPITTDPTTAPRSTKPITTSPRPTEPTTTRRPTELTPTFPTTTTTPRPSVRAEVIATGSERQMMDWSDEGWWQTLEPTIEDGTTDSDSAGIPPPGERSRRGPGLDRGREDVPGSEFDLNADWLLELDAGLEPSLDDEWAAALEPTEPPRDQLNPWPDERRPHRSPRLQPA